MTLESLSVSVQQDAGAIKFNFNEIKTTLTEQMELYKNLELTEDKKAELKTDVATLRKIQKAIDGKRKEVKKEFTKPLDNFEKQAKELINIIEEPVKIIGGKIKEFDERRRAEKKQSITNEFNRTIGDMGEYLKLESIYVPGWENTSTSMKKIREEIEIAVSSTKIAVQTINDMESDAVPDALELYKKNNDLAASISLITEYEKKKVEIIKREEERKTAEVKESQEVNLKDQNLSDEPTVENEETDMFVSAGVCLAEKSDDLFVAAPLEATYIVKGTEEQLKKMEETLKAMNIQFRRS